MAFTVTIEQDTFGDNPRHEWDHSTTFMMAHRRYAFGDKDAPHTMEAIQDAVARVTRNGGEVLPVYMYDHSGLTIATTPFSCPWDSGQIGYITMTKAQMREVFLVKRVTKAVRQRARALMVGDIATMDMYLRGEVYWVVVKDEAGNVLESVGGIYGYDEAEREGQALLASVAEKENV